VAIPGFYDRVQQLHWAERESMALTGPSSAQILRDAGTNVAHGERGYSVYERVTVRPALTINGISGGYSGPGGKGVIPSRATAKMSFRLVSDQKPAEVETLIRRHLKQITPPTVQLSMRIHQSANPAIIDRRHPALRAAALAYRRGFGRQPVFLRCGGTIPVVNHLQTILGISTVLMGFALPEDRLHAPNESFSLANFFRGIETSIWFLSEMARSSWIGRRSRIRTADATTVDTARSQ
jgi:acetylornithine deacetylase/succinyl-diaminopimelate desuccinylase-like protein